MIVRKMNINEIYIKIQFCNCYFNKSIEVKKKEKLETKNISFDQKSYKNLVIYFTRYVHNKSIKILRLHYDELVGKTEELEVKKN